MDDEALGGATHLTRVLHAAKHGLFDGEIEAAQWFDRATIRRLLATADGWTGADGDGVGEGNEMTLPGEVSIARRMIQGWAERG